MENSWCVSYNSKWKCFRTLQPPPLMSCRGKQRLNISIFYTVIKTVKVLITIVHSVGKILVQHPLPSIFRNMILQPGENICTLYGHKAIPCIHSKHVLAQTTALTVDVYKLDSSKLTLGSFEINYQIKYVECSSAHSFICE